MTYLNSVYFQFIDANQSPFQPFLSGDRGRESNSEEEERKDDKNEGRRTENNQREREKEKEPKNKKAEKTVAPVLPNILSITT